MAKKLLHLRTMLVAISFCCYGLDSPGTSLANGLQTLALSDQIPAEIGIGTGSYTFDAPAISENGDVVYRAMFNPDEAGANDVWAIWKDFGNTKQLITKTGDDALVVGQSLTFVDFELPEINQSGEMAFYGTTTYGTTPEGKTVGGPGVWKANAAGNVDRIVSNGDFMPGTSIKYRSFGDFPAYHVSKKLHIGSSGDVLLFANLRNTVSGETELSMWSTTDGLHRVYAYDKSHPVSGLDPGFEFDDIAQSTAIDENGHAKILSILPGMGAGMLSEQSGTASLDWQQTVPTLGISTPLLIEYPGYANWNESGQVLLSSNLDNSWGGLIFLDPEGTSRIVVDTGDAAPGTPWGDAEFGYLDTETSYSIQLDAINNAGQAAFLNVARSANAGEEAYGLWAEDAGDMRMVAMGGLSAPGIPGAIFSPYLSSAISTEGGVPSGSHNLPWFASVITLSDAGQVAFLAHFKEPDGDTQYSSGTGIWAEDAEQNLTLIARTGGAMTVAQGDERIISRLNLLGQIDSCTNQERNSGFNSQGQLTFHATFTDGTSGIFLSNAAAIPEPTCLLIALVGLSIASTFYRRYVNR